MVFSSLMTVKRFPPLLTLLLYLDPHTNTRPQKKKKSPFQRWHFGHVSSLPPCSELLGFALWGAAVERSVHPPWCPLGQVLLQRRPGSFARESMSLHPGLRPPYPLTLCPLPPPVGKSHWLSPFHSHFLQWSCTSLQEHKSTLSSGGPWMNWRWRMEMLKHCVNKGSNRVGLKY